MIKNEGISCEVAGTFISHFFLYFFFLPFFWCCPCGAIHRDSFIEQSVGGRRMVMGGGLRTNQIKEFDSHPLSLFRWEKNQKITSDFRSVDRKSNKQIRDRKWGAKGPLSYPSYPYNQDEEKKHKKKKHYLSKFIGHCNGDKVQFFVFYLKNGHSCCLPLCGNKKFVFKTNICSPAPSRPTLVTRRLVRFYNTATPQRPHTLPPHPLHVCFQANKYHFFFWGIFFKGISVLGIQKISNLFENISKFVIWKIFMILFRRNYFIWHLEEIQFGFEKLISNYFRVFQKIYLICVKFCKC